MDRNEFINGHLTQATQHLAKENKQMYIIGDWNFNLLEFSKHGETNFL
jgi:hypothetical protein